MVKSKRVSEEPYAGYTEKVDVYMLGVMFYWLMCSVPPFDRHSVESDTDMARLVLKGQFRLPDDIQNLSKEALDFIKACLAMDDEIRLTMDQAAEHPYLTQDPATLTPLSQQELRATHSTIDLNLIKEVGESNQSQQSGEEEVKQEDQS